MADWYVSSTAHAAVPMFVPSVAYTVGQFVRASVLPTNVQERYVFRCTTAGTAGTEPTWTSAANNNNTIVSGGATFTNVTGQSAYGWSAAWGSLYGTIGWWSSRVAVGDRIFISSDSAENLTSGMSGSWGWGAGGWGSVQVISVNRAGSVPPGAADAQPGATVTINGGFTFDAGNNQYLDGVNFISTAAGTGHIYINTSQFKQVYLKNGSLGLGTASGSRITSGNVGKLVLDNSSVLFGNIAQKIATTGSYSLEVVWLKGALAGSNPTILFGAEGPGMSATVRGVDLSAVASIVAQGGSYVKVLLDSCRINPSVTRYNVSSNALDEVELVNCFDGTNVVNERWVPAGSVVTDRSTHLSNGAQDDVSNYSLKLASASRADKWSMPLDCFALDVENVAVSTLKTATVEIISSAALNNDDISLLIEHMGTAGDSIASFVSSLFSVLTPAAALPTSSATWNNPPATPQKQLLQTTFLPQRAGRVRGLVRLGKPSATAWVNPQITIANSPYSATVWQFLNRTSGLDATHVSAYQALIDGLVTDGVWSKLDVLYIYATQSAANASLNLVSNNYNAGVRGSPTFTVDRGFTGVDNSTTVFIDTGFNCTSAPSPKFTQNSGHLSAWNVTNNWAYNGAIGSYLSGPGNANNCQPQDKGSGYGSYVICANGVIGDQITVANASGHFIANRTGVNAKTGYRNAVAIMTRSDTSTAPHNVNLTALGVNVDGVPKGAGFQLAMNSIGSGLTPTDATNFYNRLRTYMTVVGVP